MRENKAEAASVSASTSGARPTPDRSRVVVAACPSYSARDVEGALAEIMEALGGIAAFVKPGQTVLVKPNLFTAHPPERAVTTHPELVRQVVLLCAEAGARRVWVGDSPVGSQDEAALWLRTGMTAAVSGLPAELKSWRTKQAPLACGDDVLAVPEWYRDVDVVISLPKLKAHCLTTITCGLKNIFGLVSGQAKAQFHLKYPSPLSMSAFLVRVFATFRPTLTIADAVMAMEGNGPAHGRPLAVGALLGSRDAVALDAVACAALRVTPSTVPMIRVAAASNLGCMGPCMIDCVGSGLPRLQAAHMKPSLSRFLRRVPDRLFRLTTAPWRMRPKVVKRECAKCGNCAKVCPKKAISEHVRTGYPQIDRANCIACFCCMESCPQGAISVGLYFGPLLCVAQQRRRKAEAE